MPSDKTTTFLTDTQLKIADDLRELDSSLGDMYMRCIVLIDQYRMDSPTARIDVALIGHCAREVINRLPDALMTGSRIKGMQACEKAARDQLVLTFDCAPAPKAFADDASVQIPKDLYDALNDFVEAVQTGSATGKSRDLIALSVSGAETPAYSSWKTARKFFVGYAHLDGDPDRKLPSPEEVRAQFELIESSITVRMGHFFEAKRRLNEVLNSANETIGGNHQKPSDESVQLAISMMNSLPLRRIFYTQLENPRWLLPLMQKDAFKEMPTENPDATEYDHWPESKYLFRCVDSDPERVSSILQKAERNSNFAVKESTVWLAAKLPAEYAKNLAGIIGEWAEDAGNNNIIWCDTNELASLIASLLANNSTKKTGDQLLYKCFGFADGRSNNIAVPIPKVFPDYEYKECLDIALGPLEAQARVMFCKRILKQYFQLRFGNNGILMNWYYPSIAISTESAEADASHALIATLVSSLKDLVRINVELFAKTLEDNGVPIVKRACLFVLEEAIKSDDLDSRELLVATAMQIANSDIVFDEEYEAELIPLVRTICNIRDVSAISGFLRKVAEDRKPGLEIKEESMRESGLLDEASELELKERQLRWQHRILSLVGRQNLQESSLNLLVELDDRFGSDIEYSLGHVQSTTIITGPNSPISVDDMADMGVDELIAHLRTWHPNDSDRFALISHDGQGRELQKLVASNPYVFEGHLEEITTLRPQYIRAVLEGWTSAMESDVGVPLQDFVALITCGAKQEEGSILPRCQGWDDDDQENNALKIASARAISTILDSDRLLDEAQGYSTKLLDALAYAAESTEPDAAYEKKYGGDNMDPVTLAINTVRPMALIGISKWVVRFYDNAETEMALEILRNHMPDQSKSKADAGAFIQTFASIAERHKSWLENNLVNLFGDGNPNECQQAMLTGILSFCRPSMSILEMLRPVVHMAMENGCETYYLGFTLNNHCCPWHIGNWLYQLVAAGNLELNDALIATWLETTPPAICGSVLDHLCWLVQRSKGLSPTIVNRVCAIWDSHAKLAKDNPDSSGFLSGIAWMVMDDDVGSSWWGPRLAEEIRASEYFKNLSLISTQLLDYSNADPCGAFEVLDAYVANHRNTHNRLYPLERIAPTILANALKLDDQNLNKRIRMVMDKLGSLGFVDLDELVAI